MNEFWASISHTSKNLSVFMLGSSIKGFHYSWTLGLYRRSNYDSLKRVELLVRRLRVKNQKNGILGNKIVGNLNHEFR